MKSCLSILLCISLLLCLTSCASKEAEYIHPVALYYRTAAADDDLPDSVISAVTAEGDGFQSDPKGLLNEYLKGTSESGFLTTFPASTKLLTFQLQDGTADLLLNNSIARLTGVDLTIACACITLTTMELTGATTVRIRTSSGTLDGADEIIMDANTLVLMDLYASDNP